MAQKLIRSSERTQLTITLDGTPHDFNHRDAFVAWLVEELREQEPERLKIEATTVITQKVQIGFKD